MRILSEAAVEAMTTDRLTAEQRKGRPFGGPEGYWEGQGFGLRVAIKTSPTAKASELGVASVGRFGWPGIFGTWWFADPRQDMILVLMVPGGEARAVRWAFQQAADQAIVSE